MTNHMTVKVVALSLIKEKTLAHSNWSATGPKASPLLNVIAIIIKIRTRRMRRRGKQGGGRERRGASGRGGGGEGEEEAEAEGGRRK